MYDGCLSGSSFSGGNAATSRSRSLPVHVGGSTAVNAAPPVPREWGQDRDHEHDQHQHDHDDVRHGQVNEVPMHRVRRMIEIEDRGDDCPRSALAFTAKSGTPRNTPATRI